MRTEPAPRAAADIAPVAALLAEPSRARIVSALLDGRALPASVLSDEAGVSASTASEHLQRLLAGRLVTVERSGRHRYYRLAGGDVAAAVEALAVISPQPPVRSLRESTRSAALRRARTCYDHVAGRLGVAIAAGLLDRGALVRTDGVAGVRRSPRDPLASSMRTHPYRLGSNADSVFGALGVDLAAVSAEHRPALRMCVDWSEQRHHLAGGLGAAVLGRLESTGGLRRLPRQRAVELTGTGAELLRRALGVDLDAARAESA